MAAPSEKDLFQYALGLHQKGLLAQAEKLYHDLLAGNPKHFEALHLIGLIRYREGQLEEAAKLIRQALAIDPAFATAHYNLGLCLDELQDYDAAISHFTRAGELGFDRAQAENAIGGVLIALKRPEEAQARLAQALRLRPGYANALANQAMAMRQLGNMTEAVAAADKALALAPDNKNVRLVLGFLLTDLKYAAEGLGHLDKAAALGATSPELHTARAKALAELNRFDEALAAYDQLKVLRPHADAQDFEIFNAKAKICAWEEFDRAVAAARANSNPDCATTKPFALSQMIDAPEEILAAAQQAAAALASDPAVVAAQPAPARLHRTGKIRLGYFSGDFCSHPVGQLIGGVIAAHDRERFEIHAFSQGPVTGDEFQNRIIDAADRYYHTQKFSPALAISQAREKNLDLAIDLSGFTAYSRPSLFAARVAPIQVNYLGYPGTTGAPTTDYLIADETVIPEDHRRFYTEKVAYLPGSFLPHDPSRSIGQSRPTRAEAGLPEHAIVFCSFNNFAKLNPETFSRWMRILARVPDSVLWLPSGTLSLQANLRREAEARGIAASRLCFAPYAARHEYFDRFALADLFLDSFPYNAHTTAADALWGGVPVLTLAGQGFQARVAASVLRAAGLPELVTTSGEEFEALGVALAQDPARIASYKRHLAEKRATLPLFDVPRYTRHLELAYQLMFQRQQHGLSPDHLFVKQEH